VARSYIRQGTPLTKLDGTAALQEFNLRAAKNIPGIIGFSRAVELATLKRLPFAGDARHIDRASAANAAFRA
jgi:hypothetical protein